MPDQSIKTHDALKWRADLNIGETVVEKLAVEEPLEIRLGGRRFTLTMRTPGHDEELALGFLYGEGLIDGARSAGPTADFAANAVEVEGLPIEDVVRQSFFE